MMIIATVRDNAKNFNTSFLTYYAKVETDEVDSDMDDDNTEVVDLAQILNSDQKD